jgi:hypothetical protein
MIMRQNSPAADEKKSLPVWKALINYVALIVLADCWAA